MGNFKGRKNANLSLDAFKLISSIKNPAKRNLARGYAHQKPLSLQKISELRKDNWFIDESTMGALMREIGRDSMRNPLKRSCKDLFIKTVTEPFHWTNELLFFSGYINSFGETAIAAAEAMKKLAEVSALNPDSTLDVMIQFSKTYGASNYLSYKLAYIRSAHNLTAKQLAKVSQIEDEIEHKEAAGYHFGAIENISSKISIFSVAQRRTTDSHLEASRDIRQSPWTSNLAPTPLSIEDIASLLHRAPGTSLIDCLHLLLILLNLESHFTEVASRLKTNVDKMLITKLQSITNTPPSISTHALVTKHYSDLNLNSSESLNIYRISAAFLERQDLACYRHRIDRVIAARLLQRYLSKSEISPADKIDMTLILQPDETRTGREVPEVLDIFYRTYLFLVAICDKHQILSLSAEQITYILENTLGLELLLTEEEIHELSLMVPIESQPLVTVLALALFKEKTVDPDIDFEFRDALVSFVSKNHGGSIVHFVEHLLEKSPQIANYIVGSLDEQTIEKMYAIIQNSTTASQTRCEILRAVGQKLNKIEYFVEADAISTRSKLSSLRKYFDGSRMYVDSIAMKKWLDSNPTVSTEQYRSLYPQVGARMASIGDAIGGASNILVIELADQSQYLIDQIAKDAFEQFCLNSEFGIQSFLGRRIRHNTLDGVMINPVNAISKRPEFRPLFDGKKFRASFNTWLDSYKCIIEKLKRDYLQFKSSSSLFKSTIDPEDRVSKENIRNLAQNLRAQGGHQLLNELVVSFCWRQISPQLESAARFIRIKLLTQVITSMEKHFPSGAGHLEDQFLVELRDAMNSVFAKVADWFQIPQTGFVSASVAELCQTISLDLSRNDEIEYSGKSFNTKYTGISVHRIYDCLAVLLQNSFLHGRTNSKVLVRVDASKPIDRDGFERLDIAVTSTTEEPQYALAKKRIVDAINSEEKGIDMFTEGYTGIKKLKLITKNAEGRHTIRFEEYNAEHQITIGFSLLAELALDSQSEAAVENH